MALVPAELEQLSRPRETRPLSRRELAVQGVAGLAFVAAAVALLVLADGGPAPRWDVAAVLVVAVAAALRAQFDVGAGYVPPTQLVFVPVLFLEPVRLAPVIALAGWALGRVPDIARGELHPTRLLNVPANCWFAIGPAVVLAAAGSPGPDWGDWPLYLLALVAQVACDVASGAVRDRLDPEVEQAPALRGYAFVWAIDAALSPIGLLAAFASEDGRFAFLAVLPLAALLVSFSHERTRRFEAERSALRAREALIAGASHELQTPLAVVSGIVERLTRGPELPAERRAQAYATLERQTGHLRYLVGRFVHYSRLKAGQPLPRRPRTVALDDALAGVAALWTPEATIELDAAPGLAVHADPGDVHAVLMALVANALKHGPPSGPVRVSARARDGRMTIEVADRGPGLPEDRLESVFAELDLGALDEGAGIGLFLARTAARQHGGDVRLRNGSGGGLVAIVELPSA